MMQGQYDAHLPALLFRYRDNLQTLLAGTFLPNLHGHVICKNWNLCEGCWDYW